MKSLFSVFWQYMCRHLPATALRHIHTTLAVLVILQIINSNLLFFSHQGMPDSGWIATTFLWFHIVCGILTTLLTIVLIVYIARKQSFRRFYPYLWGENQAVLADLKTLYRFSLPDDRPQGLANIVQGLGIVALIGIEVTALLWLVLWQQHSLYANDIRVLHKTLTGFIEVYLVAHGGMALLHCWLERKLTR